MADPIPETADAEEEWRAADRRLAFEILRRASITLWAAAGADQNYAIRMWSPGAEEIYGYSRDEAIGKSYIDLFVNPKERHDAIGDHERIISEGDTYEWDWAADDLHADGSLLTMLTNCFRVQDPETGEWLLAELGIDISDLNRASQTLRRVHEEDHRRTELRFIKAIGEIGQAVAELGDDGTLGSVASAIFTAVRKVITGVSDVHVWVDQHDELVTYGDPTRTELSFTVDEAVKLVRTRQLPIFYDPSTKDPSVIRLARRGRRGQTRSFAILPLRGLRGSRDFGVLAIALDSNRVFKEEELERMTRLAVFAGQLLSIASELQRTRREGSRRLRSETKDLVIRNVLHTVGGEVIKLVYSVELLQNELEKLELTGDARRSFEGLKADTDQLADSLKNLRTQLDEPDIAELVYLREPVSSIVQPLRVSHTGVDIRIEVDPTVIVFAARSHVHHMLHNLINNAVQILEAVDGGGDVLLWSQQTDGDVEIHIEDSGPGVPLEIRSTLFNEGVSLRADGTGQGLYIARDLARLSGGEITLEDQASLGGAHFCLRLPATVAPTTDSGPAP